MLFRVDGTTNLRINLFIIERLIRLVFGITAFISIASYVSFEELGVISLSTATFAIMYLVLQLEAKPYVIGLINNREFSLSQFSLFIQSSILLSSILVVMTVFYFVFFNFSLVAFVGIIGAAMVSTLNCAKWINEGLERFEVTLSVDIFANLLAFVGKILVVYFTLDWRILLLIAPMEFFAVGVINYAMIPRSFSQRYWNSFKRLDFKNLVNLCYKLAPLLIAGISVVLYSRVDMFMLAKMCGITCTGEYTLAMRFAELIVIPSTLFVTFLAPRFLNPSKDFKSFELEFEAALRLNSLVTLSSFLALGLAMNVLYNLTGIATPKNLNEVYISLGLSFVVSSLGIMSSIYINKIERRKYLAERCIYGLIANLALNMLFIPFFGTVGAAAATLISQLISSILFDLIKDELRGGFRLKIFSFLINPRKIPEIFILGYKTLTSTWR